MTAGSRFVIAASLVFLGAGAARANPPQRDEAAQIEFFERKIRPLLSANCYNCHSTNTNTHGGLRIDDRNGLLEGGKRGPAVVPGQPDKSLLVQAVRRTHKAVKMPPKKVLTATQVTDLERWIRDGAAWPRETLPPSMTRTVVDYDALRKKHWAWQPLRPGSVPRVKDAAWPSSDVDRYVLAALERKGLVPVADADRVTLIRRVTFDLTGLPPTPAAIDAYVKDRSPGAFARVVDRLLASPHFGERWGRHWLDVARYSESTGPSRNIPYPPAWRYRDYVFDAFNADMPYDQFLREQVAGDLLPAATPRQRDAQLIATGFLALGARDVNQRFRVRFVMDNVDEQLDTLGRAVLALSIGCARCHNHKFDPIPTADYYALAGIFVSTDLCAGVRSKMGGGGLDYYDKALFLPLAEGGLPESGPETAAAIARLSKQLQAARAEFKTLQGTPKGKERGPDGRPRQAVARQKVVRLEKQLDALRDPLTRRATLGARDAKKIGDTAIRIRGEAERLGPVVPRGFLSVLDVPGTTKINPNQSGRLELAQWLTSPNNPLTPRVLVNRVWHHLFGQGIVATVDNFGTTGALPSHPELLDDLAARFVRDGWSVKRLVRTLVLSRAYQLGTETPTRNMAADPANRLVWRHSPRRLDAEEIRDAMLVAAGTLNRARPLASPVQDLKVQEIGSAGPEAKKLRAFAATSRHRSVYLPLLRGLTPRALEVFDFPEQALVSGARDATTVAPQALYLLNDPFVAQQAKGLAGRVLASPGPAAGRLRRAYRLALGRVPTPHELKRALAYLDSYEADARNVGETAVPEPGLRTAAWVSFCQALLASAEFRYVR